MLFGAVSYISPKDIGSFFQCCADLMADDSVLVLEPWYEEVEEGGGSEEEELFHVGERIRLLRCYIIALPYRQTPSTLGLRKTPGFQQHCIWARRSPAGSCHSHG